MRPLVFWVALIGLVVCLVTFVPAVHQAYGTVFNFPDLDHGPQEFAWSIARIAVEAFFAPAHFLIEWFWQDVLGLRTNPYTSIFMPFFVAFLVGFPFVFWSVLLSRLPKFFGVWEPFAARNFQPALLLMKAGVMVREWFDITAKFGRTSTGGWAGLVEVLSTRFKDGQVFLGRPKLIIGGMLRPIGLSTEKHMVTIASSGSG